MKCSYCDAQLEYGYKYCIKCGEKIPKSVVDEAYNQSFWGKADGIIDKYENSFVKKITGNYVFRIIVMIISITLIYFGVYGSDYRLHIAESDIYTVQYDMNKEEFYILSDEDEFVVDVYIPKHCNQVRFSCYSGEDVTQQVMPKEQCKIGVVKNKFDYMIIEAMRGEKVVQTLKFSTP